jgi:hypothetical protein
VVAVDRRVKTLVRTATEVGPAYLPVVAAVSHETECARAVAERVDRFGRIPGHTLIIDGGQTTGITGDLT